MKIVTHISSKKRWLRELFFDLREPGINIWIIPIVSVCFVICSLLLQSHLGVNNTVTLSVMEIMIPFMGGYASIMIMQGLLDTEGCEILYTYNRSYLYWGILRQIRLFSVQIVHIILVCGSIAVIMEESFVPLLVLTVVQSFAVMSVSFFGMALTKKVSVALINLIFIVTGSVPDDSMLMGVCVRSIFIGIFGGSIGQLWIRP